jgi:hypothetical protein
VVYVRYKDHVLFKDSDASQYRPFLRECVGWLDFEDSELVRVVWERFSMPDPPNEAMSRSTGLVIMKNAVLEYKRIA